MKTTKQWWDEVSQDPDKMIQWLKAQYHGEVTAEQRIRGMITQFNVTGPAHIRTLNQIADEENTHALWVKELLEVRGIDAVVLDKEERYWNETLPAAEEIDTLTYMCAVAHLAETMRLERINLLATDSRFKDIAKVFANILPDEEFHAEAFKMMSSTADIAEATIYHNNGLNALGLVA